MDFFKELPQELSDFIFSYLNIDDLSQCLYVSKKWHKECNNPSITKMFVIKSLKKSED